VWGGSAGGAASGKERKFGGGVTAGAVQDGG
jgi:hypothetical protein